MAIASFAVGLALLTLVVSRSGLGLPEIFSRLAALDRIACLRLTGLLAVNTFLSSLKWRLTDSAMRRPSDGSPSHFESFTLSSIGTALGQVLPVQLSMPAARTLGAQIYGRAFERGTLGTFFEQSFDPLFSCFLMLGSAAAYLLNGGWRMWLTMAVFAAALAIVSAGTMLNLVRRLAAAVSYKGTSKAAWRRFALKLSHSALLEAGLGRRLMFLSALRFTVLVLMARETAVAIHADIPLWHLAAAMPFAVFATASGITPGGLGLTEFTYATILSGLGTPITLTTEWALANRLLISGASISVAVLLLPFFLAFRTAAKASESPAQ